MHTPDFGGHPFPTCHTSASGPRTLKPETMTPSEDLSQNRGLPKVAAREGDHDFSAHRDARSRTSRRKLQRERMRTKRTAAQASQDSESKQSGRPTRDLSIPLKARITEGKLRVSNRLQKQPDGTTNRVQFLYAVSHRTRACRTTRTPAELPSTDCVNTTDASNALTTSPPVSTLDDEALPSLESDDYIFDASEYRRWHDMFAFNYDGAASHLNAKCKDFASKDKPFTSLSPQDLKNKTIWLCPPIAEATAIISHFETIRQAQPKITSAILVLPRITTPGAAYKNLLSKYVQLHTYYPGTYLFEKYDPDTAGPSNFRTVRCMVRG